MEKVIVILEVEIQERDYAEAEKRKVSIEEVIRQKVRNEIYDVVEIIHSEAKLAN